MSPAAEQGQQSPLKGTAGAGTISDRGADFHDHRHLGVASWFVARANIYLYIDLLNDADLAPEIRATVTKLLIEEEDKLGDVLEQLEFAEKRAADGRNLLNHLLEIAVEGCGRYRLPFHASEGIAMPSICP